jgi:hypothetical protein
MGIGKGYDMRNMAMDIIIYVCSVYGYEFALYRKKRRTTSFEL